jgi:hypothetical protein
MAKSQAALSPVAQSPTVQSRPCLMSSMPRLDRQIHVPESSGNTSPFALGVNVAASTPGGCAAHKKDRSWLRSETACTVQFGSRWRAGARLFLVRCARFGALSQSFHSSWLAALDRRTERHTRAYIRRRELRRSPTTRREFFAPPPPCALARRCPSRARRGGACRRERATIGRLQGSRHQRCERRLTVYARQRLEPLREIRRVQPPQRRNGCSGHQRVIP